MAPNAPARALASAAIITSRSPGRLGKCVCASGLTPRGWRPARTIRSSGRGQPLPPPSPTVAIYRRGETAGARPFEGRVTGGQREHASLHRIAEHQVALIVEREQPAGPVQHHDDWLVRHRQRGAPSRRRGVPVGCRMQRRCTTKRAAPSIEAAGRYCAAPQAARIRVTQLSNPRFRSQVM